MRPVLSWLNTQSAWLCSSRSAWWFTKYSATRSSIPTPARDLTSLARVTPLRNASQVRWWRGSLNHKALLPKIELPFEASIMRMKQNLLSFLLSEQGAELAEYAVGVALLVAIGLIVYEVLGDAIVDENNGTAAAVTGATWTAP